MKQPQHTPVLKSDALQRQASAHAGATSAPAGPRQAQQGEQIAQLMDGEGRKAKGHSLGASHSKKAPNGKTTSHKPGKGRSENPRKSAAMNRKRERMLRANVANSIAKDSGR